jgi:lipopolysaccharide export system permease protein
VKTLYRYLLGQIVTTTLVAVMVLTSVFVLFNARKIFDLLVNHDVPVGDVLSMVLLLFPQALTFTIPWGFLIAILLVMGRFSQDLELQAVTASGIGLIPLIAPVVLFSIVVSFLCFYNNASLAPRSMTTFKYRVVDMGRNNPTAFLKAGEPITSFSGKRIYIGSKSGNRIEDVHVWELDKDNIPIRTIRAERGLISADLENLVLNVTLYEAALEERSEDGTRIDRIQAGLKAKQLPLTIPLGDALDTSRIQRNITIITVGQIGQRIFSQAGIDNLVPLLTELQKRLAFSFAPFTFCLIGIPLAIRVQRKETSIGVVLSLAVVISYYLLVFLAMTLQNKAEAWPDLIVWTPNFLFQGVGIALLYRANFR